MALNITRPSLPTLLHRLPPELRLEIFTLAFAPESAREVITVTRSSQSSSSTSTTTTAALPQLDLHFKDQHKTKHAQQFERRKLWLQPHLVGPDLALEAAEALYSSKAMFAVHASDLPAFLAQCPLSGLSNPGRLISRLHLYADEDPCFASDSYNLGRSHGVHQHHHALRLADWVDHSPSAPSAKRSTRSSRANVSARTTQMRAAWRLILLMPSLTNFELRLLPHQGRLPISHLTHLEIRDVLPSLFRLFSNGVAVQLYVRTWTTISRADPLPSHRAPDPQNPNTFEDTIDLDAFLPFGGAGVRVPEVEKKEMGKNVGQIDTRVPLGCLQSTRGVAEAGRWAVRGEAQARCRKALYFALEGLFLRLLESGEYEPAQNDIVRIRPSSCSSSTSSPSPSTSPSPLRSRRGIHHHHYKHSHSHKHSHRPATATATALPTPPNTPPFPPRTAISPHHSTYSPSAVRPPSPLFSFPAVAKLLRGAGDTAAAVDGCVCRHGEDRMVAWRGRVVVVAEKIWM